MKRYKSATILDKTLSGKIARCQSFNGNILTKIEFTILTNSIYFNNFYLIKKHKYLELDLILVTEVIILEYKYKQICIRVNEVKFCILINYVFFFIIIVFVLFQYLMRIKSFL